MSTRLALTPAVGLFTGLSMVSFGAVSMFLTGVHGTTTQATNPCTAAKTAAGHTIAAGHGNAAHTAAVAHSWRSDSRSGAPAGQGAPAGHVAHLPVLLDAAVRTISAGPAAQQHSTPAPSPAPSTTPPPPPTPNPTPGSGNVTPNPKPNPPNPGATPLLIPGTNSGSSPSVAPGGTEITPTATPTPTPTSTPTTTPTPTPTSTSTPPTATLCLTVQTLGGSNAVDPGGSVHVAIWVWLTSGTGGTAKLSLTASPSRVKPIFSVCQPTGQATCSVGGLTAGQHVQTQAKVSADKSLAGRDIKLTVTATSAQAVKSVSASDTIRVRSKNHSSSSPTPTPTAPGDGGTLPPGTFPGSTFPGATNPNPAGNLGTDFPQVSPSPSASAAASQGHQHPVTVTDLSAGLPLDVRLIGGQVIGLAILAAAVTIAIARLTLRRQPPRHSEDSASSTPAS